MEVSNDAQMKRTMRRPLPSGRLSIPHAVLWAAGVGITGVMILACKVSARLQPHDAAFVIGDRYISFQFTVRKPDLMLTEGMVRLS